MGLPACAAAAGPAAVVCCLYPSKSLLINVQCAVWLFRWVG